MPDFTDIIRDGIRSLQVAFDKQWASLCGLMSSQRVGRIMWGTNVPLELEGVEGISLGAAAVFNRRQQLVSQCSSIRPVGLEPTTLGLEIPCSIQLSYGRTSLSFNPNVW